MIYPGNFEYKTGFDQVRNLLKEHCLCTLGMKQVDQMHFSGDYDTVRELIDQTAEFKEICLLEENFPTDNYTDPSEAVRKAKIEGSHLEVEELIRLKKSLDALKAILFFFQESPQDKYLSLKKLANNITYFSYVGERLDKILSRDGRIKDNASKELRDIREAMAKKHAAAGKLIHQVLKRVISSGIADKESAISVRNSRQVIPIPAANKKRLSGIIHDESATGQTVFIEPAEVVEVNNELRELEISESHEIIRILIAFTNSIRPYADDLLAGLDFVGTIDFIRAKALFAIRIGAGRPALVMERGLYWKEAVHPLLFLYHAKEQKDVIPLDIVLNREGRILIISGPNAGGKSVCLKTVGLLQYMLQCGMLVPMKESSEAGIFEDVLIDIGDEQSIENDLSTYSSHLLNMKIFLRHATPKSLILIDEFGSGTEPLIGGAIAEAVLIALNRKGTFGVITTHYANLKYFASSSEGIVNGAMLFDTGKIKPLFRLEIGKPGSSFAIDIARQIGLPEEILHVATEKAGEDHIRFDKFLREILRDKKYWKDKREKVRISEKNLSAVLEQYQEELDQIRVLKKEILSKARTEAEELLSGANREIEKTIRIIRETQAEKEKTKAVRSRLQEYRQGSRHTDRDKEDLLDNKQKALDRSRKQYVRDPSQDAAGAEADNPKEATIKKGDVVKLPDRQTAGEVLEVSGDNLLVTFGESMITSVKKSEVQVLGPEAHKAYRTAHPMATPSRDLNERKLNFRNEIDIRGKRGMDAVEIVKHFIDDATVVGVSELRILHGKGNGILKHLVREYLGATDIVRSFGDEREEIGGSGITVVKLDF